MKKVLLTGAVFVAALFCLPGQAQAQFYSGYTYNNNAYLNYALSSQKARATRNRGRHKARGHRKHSTRRARRSSRGR